MARSTPLTENFRLGRQLPGFLGVVFLEKEHCSGGHSCSLSTKRSLEPLPPPPPTGLVVIQALLMLERGVASFPDIDVAVMAGANMPMGPFVLADYVGLDTCLSILEGWCVDVSHFRRCCGGLPAKSSLHCPSFLFLSMEVYGTLTHLFFPGCFFFSGTSASRVCQLHQRCPSSPRALSPPHRPLGAASSVYLSSLLRSQLSFSLLRGDQGEITSETTSFFKTLRALRNCLL